MKRKRKRGKDATKTSEGRKWSREKRKEEGSERGRRISKSGDRWMERAGEVRRAGGKGAK